MASLILPVASILYMFIKREKQILSTLFLNKISKRKFENLEVQENNPPFSDDGLGREKKKKILGEELPTLAKRSCELRTVRFIYGGFSTSEYLVLICLHCDWFALVCLTSKRGSNSIAIMVNFVRGASYYGLAAGEVKGGLPSARIAVCCNCSQVLLNEALHWDIHPVDDHDPFDGCEHLQRRKKIHQMVSCVLVEYYDNLVPSRNGRLPEAVLA
ncbi:hypothetical protein IFM89_028259 [Coptis chinensis]|uniref:Uncharacterized protein n=1 Tax=Coptis chinensis TaxID=261450 RepID=A0A835HG60_9MAGN|nr:hypothetical protein IFM89_028259 [Coptis chinensis]